MIHSLKRTLIPMGGEKFQVCVDDLTNITSLTEKDFTNDELEDFRKAPYFIVVSMSMKYAMERKYVPRRLWINVPEIFALYFQSPDDPEFHSIL